MSHPYSYGTVSLLRVPYTAHVRPARGKRTPRIPISTPAFPACISISIHHNPNRIPLKSTMEAEAAPVVEAPAGYWSPPIVPSSPAATATNAHVPFPPPALSSLLSCAKALSLLSSLKSDQCGKQAAVRAIPILRSFLPFFAADLGELCV